MHHITLRACGDSELRQIGDWCLENIDDWVFSGISLNTKAYIDDAFPDNYSLKNYYYSLKNYYISNLTWNNRRFIYTGKSRKKYWLNMRIKNEIDVVAVKLRWGI